MSDLIARIAARAVGTPAVAQPSLPAFFGGEAAAALEVADEHVAVPAAMRAEAPPPERHTAPRRERNVEVRTIETASPERLVPAPSTPPQRQTVVSSVERTIRERETAAAAPPRPLPQPPDEAVPAEPAVTVQATPVVLHATAHAAAAAAPTARVDEPPPVRVHIGRLEVRANLQQAPPPQRRREAPRAQGLTLSDYLRGKREAG